MIYGIVFQCARALPNLTPRVAQSVVVPTIGTHHSRELTTAKPRSRWVKCEYERSTHDFVPFAASSRASMWAGDPSSSSGWSLTGQPVLFQLTDSEARFMLAHPDNGIPKTAMSRMARAMESRGQVFSMLGGSDDSTRVLRDVIRRQVDLFAASAATAAAAAAGTPVSISPTAPSVAGAIIAAARAVDDLTDHHRPDALLGMLSPSGRCRGETNLSTASDFIGETTTTPAAPAPAPATSEGEEEETGRVRPGTVLANPNGSTYIARSVKVGERGVSDITLYRKLASKRRNVLLAGKPGCGKTVALQVAHPNAIIAQCTGDTTVDDFVGAYVPDGPNSFRWEDGFLVAAMEQGRHLILDEVAQLDDKVAMILMAPLDGRNDLLVTSNPKRGLVRAAPGFGVSATYNPGVNRPLIEPLSSRFPVKIRVTTDFEIAQRLGVPEQMVQVAQHMSGLVDNGELVFCPQMRELLAFRDNVSDVSLVFALRAMVSNAPDIEQDAVSQILKERFGADLSKSEARLITPLVV